MGKVKNLQEHRIRKQARGFIEDVMAQGASEEALDRQLEIILRDWNECQAQQKEDDAGEIMTRKQLNEMKKGAMVLAGEERIKALFRYHAAEVEYWNGPAYGKVGCDEDNNQKMFEKHEKKMDFYFNQMRRGEK